MGTQLALVPSAAGFDSVLVSAFASGLASGLAPDPESVFAAAAGLLLKSVAYQPLPFSWKPAAVSIVANVGLPHAVHTVTGGSLTFCRNSCWCPQLVQRYS